MGGFYPTTVKPGPAVGSSRPANAPNNGAMGGRPPSPGADASPIERMASTPPPSADFYPRTLPAPVGGGDGGTIPGGAAGTVPPMGSTAMPTGGASPAAPPSSGVTINIGAQSGAAAPAAVPTTPPTAGAPTSTSASPSSSPNANPAAPPSTAGGEMWPNATAPPAPPPPVTLKSSPTVEDLARIPDGTEVITPYATGTKKNGEIAEYHLTPAGQEAHKRATLALRERAGATPFDGDPTAPPILPLVLGKWNFNPWAQPGKQWVK